MRKRTCGAVPTTHRRELAGVCVCEGFYQAAQQLRHVGDHGRGGPRWRLRDVFGEHPAFWGKGERPSDSDHPTLRSPALSYGPFLFAGPFSPHPCCPHRSVASSSVASATSSGWISNWMWIFILGLRLLQAWDKRGNGENKSVHTFTASELS